MNRKFAACRLVLVAPFIMTALAPPAVAAVPHKPTARNDRQTLIALESEWLNEGTPENLERILAPNFVHIAPGGYFLTKSEQIAWVAKHPSPAWPKLSFAEMKVRLYGDTGIVNGIVAASDKSGRVVRKTLFTDVFVHRNGRWQAVNAQETLVTNPQ